ncbi:MAG: type VI secretion system secreted protein VgrG [Granulosicoccus sp.]|jgi:type VI secretion system secreted protein VgrG
MEFLTQENRTVKIFSELPDDTLLFSAMAGSERLSTLYDYRLEVISQNHSVALDDLLGTDITVQLELSESSEIGPGVYRHFHGVIADCAHVSGSGEFSHYELSVRPWFWFLTRNANCRIFQEKSVPEIIKDVFNDLGFSDFDERLFGTYETWRYCVQYRESDFAFLSRLMEHEGIYYYFKHENGKHTLVLADDYAAHESIAHYDKVPYYPVGDGQLRERDHLHNWRLNKQLQPGRYAASDFNFETPKAELLTKLIMKGNHAKADYEVFDYPGKYPAKTGVPVKDTGEEITKYRMQGLAAKHEIAVGEGNAQGLSAGFLFTLEKCGREDQNREYLIVESHCRFNLDDYRTGATGEFNFACRTEAIVSKQQFRAPLLTPRPMIRGPQTAMVVGKKGEEIWTDKFGRVKLQFHWDRYGKSDENSSCWVRVSQAWAGQGWGAMHLPRIGHEVIVEFLEGDPDRPIVTGRVYNGDNGVPYDLPANQTQSGIKSRSTKKGVTANFNEIRMEDKKGEEEVYIHAEKDMNVLVENNKTLKIGFDKKDKGDYTVDIKNDRTVTLDSGNDALTVKKGNRDVSIDSGNLDLQVKKGNRKATIDTGNDELKIKKGNLKETVDKGNHSLKVAMGTSKIEAMKSITLKVGGNSIVIDQKGVTITGLKVLVDAKTTADVKAGMAVTVKGGMAATVEGGLKAELKGTMTDVNGSAMVKIQGAITMIN